MGGKFVLPLPVKYPNLSFFGWESRKADNKN